MKKQNGINKLAFNKVAVAELNENQLQDVNGGTSPLCVGIIISLLITRLD
ncbi:class IIb bacteriocin, lactobin A/cerein 7B family [Flavobacterium sp.]